MRHIHILIPLLLSLLLSGCSQSDREPTVTPATVPETPPAVVDVLPPETAAATTPAEAAPASLSTAPAADPRALAFYNAIDPGAPEMLAFDAVVNGNQKLVVPGTGNNTTLTNYLKWPSSQTSLTVRQMTLVDLDQDGALELILWTMLGSDDCYGYEVLRYHGGQVYVYSLTDQSLQQLKIDGTSLIVSANSGFGFGSFVFDEQQPWGSVAEKLYKPNTLEAQAAEARHSEKADVLWLPTWEDLLYPGAPSVSDVVEGVDRIPDILKGRSTMTEAATQQVYTIDQAKLMLVPEGASAYVAQYAMVDMELDGSKEAILGIHNSQDNSPIGFVILNRLGYAESVYYRPFQDLKTDGSYCFSSGAASYGFARKYFDGSQWQETILAECYPTTLEAQQESIVYFIGGRYATPQEFAAFEADQNAKENAAWYDTWKACQAAQ